MNTITTTKVTDLSLARTMIRMDRKEKSQIRAMEQLLNLFEVWITPNIKISNKFEALDSLEMHEIYLWGPELHMLLNPDNKKNMVFVITKAISVEAHCTCYVMTAGEEKAFIDIEYPEYWVKKGYEIKYLYKVNT